MSDVAVCRSGAGERHNARLTHHVSRGSRLMEGSQEVKHVNPYCGAQARKRARTDALRKPAREWRCHIQVRAAGTANCMTRTMQCRVSILIAGSQG